ncbi:hypothetical protein J6TS7_16620 [Paenibacillus dendritiformis]|nr:hypothetical protein J6TS7_16620 [Paenibacillus dendritiformis]
MEFDRWTVGSAIEYDNTLNFAGKPLLSVGMADCSPYLMKHGPGGLICNLYEGAEANGIDSFLCTGK